MIGSVYLQLPHLYRLGQLPENLVILVLRQLEHKQDHLNQAVELGCMRSLHNS